MAQIPGSVRVAGFLAPTDSTDTYAVTDELYNRGGYRTVADLTARDTITTDRRKEGMLVRVIDTGDIYVLVGGTLNANWSLLTFGPSTGTGVTLEVQAIAENATTPVPTAPTLIWSSVTGTLLVWSGTAWISTVSDPDLTALANLSTLGFVVRTGSGTVATRQILGTSGQISVADGDGQISSAVIKLVNTTVIPGTYSKLTVDQQGRITSGETFTKADVPEDYLSLYKENLTTGPIATATGANSVAIGPGSNALANSSIALGEYAVARHHGALMQSAGRFVVNGDAQVGNYILKAVTTTNMARQLYLDGPVGTTALTIPDNSTWTFKITVTAHRTDINDGHAGFFVKGVIYRGSGADTTFLQGSVNVEVISRSNLSWTINTIADNVNGCLAIIVSGESGKTIRWLAHVETVEITG